MRTFHRILPVALAVLTAGALACSDDSPTGSNAATKLVVQAVGNQTARAAFGTSVTVQIQNASGDVVTSATNAVTIAFGANTGTILWHASGCCSDPDMVLEMVDPGSPAVIAGPTVSGSDEIAGMTINPTTLALLGADREDHIVSFNRATGDTMWIGGKTGIDYPAGLAFEQGGTGRLLAITYYKDSLYSLDQTTSLATQLGQLTVAGDSIIGATGLATDPTTGTLYALLKFESDTSGKQRHLATINPTTYIATSIGLLSEDGMADIAFAASGTLYGVTGDGGTNAETLWTINKGTAAATLVLALGNGDDGEAIAAQPATLSGTLTVNAVNGVATFPGLMINAAANGYTLQATASGLASGTSAAFNVTP